MYLTFDGLTFKGTRGDAVSITGNGNTVKNCLIKNVAENALRMTGYDNLVTGSEITRIGKGGVILDGGGRDLDVHDNIVINTDCPIRYDCRMHNGLPGHENSNFHSHFKEGGDCRVNLFASPWKSEVRQAAYPQYRHYSDDFSKPDEPDFVLNPAYSSVRHNLLVTEKG